jgi:hypothetical protein
MVVSDNSSPKPGCRAGQVAYFKSLDLEIWATKLKEEIETFGIAYVL